MAETIIDWINKNGGYNKEKLEYPMGVGAIYITYKDVVDMDKEEFLKPERPRFAPSIEDPADEYAEDAYNKARKERERIQKEKEDADRLKRDEERKKATEEWEQKSKKRTIMRKPDGTFHKNLYFKKLTGTKGGDPKWYIISRETGYVYLNRDDEMYPIKYKTVDGKLARLTEEDKAKAEKPLVRGQQLAGYNFFDWTSKNTASIYDKDDPSKKIGNYKRDSGKILDLEGNKIDFSKTPRDPEIEGEGIPTSQFHKEEKLLLYPFTIDFPVIEDYYKFYSLDSTLMSNRKYFEYFDENGNIYIRPMDGQEPKKLWKKVPGNFIDMVNSGDASFVLKYTGRKSDYPLSSVYYTRFKIIAKFKEMDKRMTPLLERSEKLRKVIDSGNRGGEEYQKKRVSEAIAKYNDTEPEYDLYKAPNYADQLVYLNKPSGLVYKTELEIAGYTKSNPISKIPFIELFGYVNPLGDVVALYRNNRDLGEGRPTEKDIREDALKIQEGMIEYKRERRLGEQPKTQASLKEIGDKAKKTLEKEDKWVVGARKMVLDTAEEDYNEMRSSDYNANKRLKRAYERNVALWKEQHPDEELRRIYKSGVREMDRIDIEAPPPKAPPKAKAPKAPVEHIRLEIAEPEAPPPKNLVINRRPPPPPPADEPPPPAEPEPEPAQPVGGVRCKEILGQQSTCLDKQVGKPTMEKLARVSNFKAVQRKANELLGDRFEGRVPLELSTRSGKKYMIGIPGTRRKVHFGDLIREDFTKHRNQKRLNDFRRRNAKWANASWDTPMWLSYHLLW